MLQINFWFTFWSKKIHFNVLSFFNVSISTECFIIWQIDWWYKTVMLFQTNLSTFPERVDGEERHDADCCDMWINVYLSSKLLQANCISPVDIVCDRLSKILNGNFVRDGAVLTNQVCDLLKVIWKSNKMYNIHGFLSRRQTERNILVVAENLRGRMVTVLKIQLLLNTLQSSSDELKPNQK